MAPQNENRPSKRHRPPSWKRRQIARRLEREAEAMPSDAAGDDQPEDITLASQADTSDVDITAEISDPDVTAEASDADVTASARAEGNQSFALVKENKQRSKEAKVATSRGGSNLKRPLEALRRRIMALERVIGRNGETITALKDMVEMQGRIIEQQGQQIHQLWDRQANLG